MKHTILALALVALLVPGCALFQTYSDEYRDAVDEAAKVSVAVNKDVEKIVTNNIVLLANDTALRVDSGDLTEADRRTILEAATEQATKLKQQTLFLQRFSKLVKSECDGADVSDTIKEALEILNKIVPEIEKFVDRLEKMWHK